MPAPVPPGFTRGPLLFVRVPASVATRQDLLQTVWREAGAYGARLLLLAVEPGQATALEDLAALFQSWECERVTARLLPQRAAALDPALPKLVEEATGIVLLGQDTLRPASTLGGTPLAQAIRRGNARGKAVAGLDGAAALLCQHILTGGAAGALRSRASFAPGLGLVNRLVVAAMPVAPPATGAARRLLAAVAINPFLLGLGLPAESAAVLYPDNTL
jgi:cyanophycinase